MATNFPTSKDDNTSLPNPSGINNTNNPSHAAQHANVNDAVKAVESKVGTGASTPAASTLLIGTGAGTSSWSQLTSAQLAAILTDETGTGSAVFANTPTLLTPKIDTINENTLGNGVTVGGVNLKSGVISTSSSVPTAAIQSGAVGSSQLAVGVPVQLVSAVFSAVGTGTTLVPFDDTIPQSTEGDQYMTLSITPRSATNRLFIEVKGNLASSVLNDMTMSLFQDATVNALAVSDSTIPTANYSSVQVLGHDMVAGTASATTFKIRAGGSVAGTTTFNGSVGARKFGGVSLSYIKITEYRA